MIIYKGHSLHINEKILQECMRLSPAAERDLDQVYLREKKRIAKLLQSGDRYEDMIWLLLERIGY